MLRCIFKKLCQIVNSTVSRLVHACLHSSIFRVHVACGGGTKWDIFSWGTKSLAVTLLMIKQVSLKRDELFGMIIMIDRAQGQATHQQMENLQLFPPFCSWFLLLKLHRQHFQMHPKPLLQLCHDHYKIRQVWSGIFFFRFNYALACLLIQVHLVQKVNYWHL